jgi:hypothetical protein
MALFALSQTQNAGVNRTSRATFATRVSMPAGRFLYCSASNIALYPMFAVSRRATKRITIGG